MDISLLLIILIVGVITVSRTIQENRHQEMIKKETKGMSEEEIKEYIKNLNEEAYIKSPAVNKIVNIVTFSVLFILIIILILSLF